MRDKTVSSSLRYKFAENLISEAGQIALSYFYDLSQLIIEKKGHQDLVSQADKNVENFIREHISAIFLLQNNCQLMRASSINPGLVLTRFR